MKYRVGDFVMVMCGRPDVSPPMVGKKLAVIREIHGNDYTIDIIGYRCPDNSLDGFWNTTFDELTQARREDTICLVPSL